MIINRDVNPLADALQKGISRLADLALHHPKRVEADESLQPVTYSPEDFARMHGYRTIAETRKSKPHTNDKAL